MPHLISLISTYRADRYCSSDSSCTTQIACGQPTEDAKFIDLTCKQYIFHFNFLAESYSSSFMQGANLSFVSLKNVAASVQIKSLTALAILRALSVVIYPKFDQFQMRIVKT